MYNGSQASTAAMNLLFSTSYKSSLGETGKYREVFMDSEIHPSQHQNQQANSGLLRFRCAPSSLLANFANNGVDKVSDSFEGFLNPRSSSPCGSGDFASPGFQDFEDKSQVNTVAEATVNSQNGYSLQLPPHYPRHNPVASSSAMDGSYGVTKTVNSTPSNLVRQNSSPPGLLNHLTVQNGYAAMRGVGNFGVGNVTNGEVSPSASIPKRQINFSSGLPSSLGVLSQISEIGGESVGACSPGNRKLESSNGDTRFYSPGFPFGSWNDSTNFGENFNGMKRDQDNAGRLFTGTQSGELVNRTLLSHHLSLPKTSVETTTMEKFLQFTDSVPCKIRAKRGCATHPRSIAERVRRTRISERMRKLQELVPNMDKQTNTADMLDLAVEYIKDLQRQYKILSDNRANCKCSSMQKSVPNPTT